MAYKPRISQFPARGGGGVGSGKTQNVKKVRNFGGKKLGRLEFLSKNDPRPFGVLKDTFLGLFGPPFGTVSRHCLAPKRPSNGPFWDRKGVQRKADNVFSTDDPGPLGVLR